MICEEVILSWLIDGHSFFSSTILLKSAELTAGCKMVAADIPWVFCKSPDNLVAIIHICIFVEGL